MIVVDASVLANALTDDGPIGDAARAELGRDPHWTAPDHVQVEVFSVICGRWLGEQIREQRAVDAIDALRSASIELVRTAPLLARMWELRNNVSGYDAAYVAVAEIYACSLVTADARLERAPDVRCPIRLALPRS
jgi:predicted nucleic acid-binding protein